MSKLRKIKAPIPLLCYGVCLIGFLAVCLWHFAGDSLARANGRLTEAQMTAADFVLAGLEQQADGTLVTLDGDPQMILEDVSSRVVRTISYTAEFDGEAREMCLYYTTKVGEDYSADRRVFPQSLGSGQYVYTLPRTSLAALRLDPCSPEENKAVTLTMSDITLNAADTLPAVWQYFVPTWYQAFCLVLYPALAAAAASIVGAVVTGRKRK